MSRYPDVTQRSGHVKDVEKTALSYKLTLDNGSSLSASKVIFAMGYRYSCAELGIDGFDQQFGTNVFTCPYCHGYEFADQRIAVIGTSKHDGNFLRLLSNWSDRIDYVRHEGPETREIEPILADLSQGKFINERVVEIKGEPGAPLAQLTNNQELSVDVFFLTNLLSDDRWPLIDRLGLPRGSHPITGKSVYETDQVGRTNLGDVFIIGDSRTGFSTLAGAANEGMIAGYMLTNDIIESRTKSIATTSTLA